MKEWGQRNENCGAQDHCALVWSQLAEPQELLHRHYQHIACSVRVCLASVTGALTEPQRWRSPRSSTCLERGLQGIFSLGTCIWFLYLEGLFLITEEKRSKVQMFFLRDWQGNTVCEKGLFFLQNKWHRLNYPSLLCIQLKALSSWIAQI